MSLFDSWNDWNSLYLLHITRHSKNKILEFLGRYSIVILCTHEPLKRAVILIAIMVLLIEIIIVQILIAFKNKMAGTHIEWLIGFLK